MSIIYFCITILKQGILLDIMNLSVCNSNTKKFDFYLVILNYAFSK